MKRQTTLIAMLMWAVCMAFAQKGYEVSKIFADKYVSAPGVTATIMNGNQDYLKKRGLNSLATFSGSAQTYGTMLQSLILADARKAIGRDVRYKNGIVSYAYLVMPEYKNSPDEDIRSYIYYINNQQKVSLIYFEGTIPRNNADSLIKSLLNK